MTFINNVQAEKSLYIAGEWQSGINTVANINPSDISESLGDFAQASEGQVEQAIQAAKVAQPEWEKTPIERKQAVLQAIGDELIARCNELGTLLSREEGKPLLKVAVKSTVQVNSSNISRRKCCVKLAITQLLSVQAFPLRSLVKPSALSPSSLLGTSQPLRLHGKSRQHLRSATA